MSSPVTFGVSSTVEGWSVNYVPGSGVSNFLTMPLLTLTGSLLRIPSFFIFLRQRRPEFWSLSCQRRGKTQTFRGGCPSKAKSQRCFREGAPLSRPASEPREGQVPPSFLSSPVPKRPSKALFPRTVEAPTALWAVVYRDGVALGLGPGDPSALLRSGLGKETRATAFTRDVGRRPGPIILKTSQGRTPAPVLALACRWLLGASPLGPAAVARDQRPRARSRTTLPLPAPERHANAWNPCIRARRTRRKSYKRANDPSVPPLPPHYPKQNLGRVPQTQRPTLSPKTFRNTF